MQSNMIEFDFRQAVEELATMRPALSSAIGRFARNLEAGNRRNRGQPRAGPKPSRLPGPPVGRAVRQHPASPPRLRTGIPATVVQRQRMLEASRRGGPPPLERTVQAGAERVAGAIRGRLLALQSGLKGLQRRLRTGTMLLQESIGSTPRRAPPSSSGGTLLSVLAMIIAAAIGWSAVTQSAKGAKPALALGDLDAKVGMVAQAIATAEGYYAPGERDGHSLPHWLNNPGSLKKPALGAESLPTWKDTGLVIFPNERMGWNALKHQVELMLTGNSGVYDSSDSIIDVARKYADGDTNWGTNVARQLGIPTNCTLGQIAEQPSKGSSLLIAQQSRQPLAKVVNENSQHK